MFAVTAALSAVTAHGTEVHAPTGADILNFALNLECLEAEFYSYAAFGTGLTAEQRGGGPEPIGGKKASLESYGAIAKEIAEDEIAHVELLRAALGDAAVPCPLINIGDAFEAAANAAAGTTLSPTFDPYENDVFFLHGAFIFEDVGVTAYKGAVSPLADLVDGDTLSVAAGILAVEAYHAGIIRNSLYYLDQEGVTTPYGPIRDVVQLISDLRDSVDGPDDLDQGLYAEDGKHTSLVPTDADALVYERDISQVLAIVYLGSADTPGGFFPEGINGVFGPKHAAETETDKGGQTGGDAPNTSAPGSGDSAGIPVNGKCNNTHRQCIEGTTCIKRTKNLSLCKPIETGSGNGSKAGGEEGSKNGGGSKQGGGAKAGDKEGSKAGDKEGSKAGDKEGSKNVAGSKQGGGAKAGNKEGSKNVAGSKQGGGAKAGDKEGSKNGAGS